MSKKFKTLSKVNGLWLKNPKWWSHYQRYNFADIASLENFKIRPFDDYRPSNDSPLPDDSLIQDDSATANRSTPAAYTRSPDNASPPHQNPSYQRSRAFRPRDRKEYDHLRKLSKNPHATLDEYGKIIIYLGKTHFIWIYPAQSLTTRRRSFHRGMDRAVVLSRSNYTSLTENRIPAEKQFFRIYSKRKVFLCRYSACRMHDLPLAFDSPEVHIGGVSLLTSGNSWRIRPKNRFGQTVCTRQHRTPINVELTTIEGVKVTSLRQTLFDVLVHFKEPEFIVPGDVLVRKLMGVADGNRNFSPRRWRNFRRRFIRFARTRRERFSMKMLLSRLDLLSPLSESPLESLIRYFCRAARLPDPVLQHKVAYSSLTNLPLSINLKVKKRDLKRYFVDLAWPDYGVAIEVDGFSKYRHESDLRREKIRENTISLEFPHLKRMTPEVLRSWEMFARLIAGAFSGRVFRGNLRE